MKSLIPLLCLALTTVCGIGFISRMPGTIGSLLGMGGFLGLGMIWVSKGMVFYLWSSLACISALFALGVVATQVVLWRRSVHDPSYIIIDEVVGMALSVWWVPLGVVGGRLTWIEAGLIALIAFGCFRILDIKKPACIGWAERLKGGVGVMMDDLIAGLATCFLTLGIMLVYISGRSLLACDGFPLKLLCGA